MRIKETKIKTAKIIDIKLKYIKTKRKLFSLIKLSDFLINIAIGTKGKTKILNGTIAELNAP